MVTQLSLAVQSGPCGVDARALPRSVGRDASAEQVVEQAEHQGDLLGQRARFGADHQVGTGGHLVGRVDPGEAGELPGPGPGVEALGVPPLALLEGGVDEDLVEGQPRLFVQGPDQPAVLLERADRAR